MALADFERVATEAISLLNAQAVTTAHPTSSTDIGTAKRNSGEIKKNVIAADLEASTAICEPIYDAGQVRFNGYRNNFVSVSSTLTPLSGAAQSAELPERIGPVSAVEIQIASGDTAWVKGEQAPLSEIQEVISNPDNVFGVAHNASGSGTGALFFIDEASNLITFSGNAVRVYVATLAAVNWTTPVLQAPEAYFGFLVARTIAKCYKNGDPAEFMMSKARESDQLMAQIRQGALVLTQLEPIMRAA
jgi:hypothetical protein